MSRQHKKTNLEPDHDIFPAKSADLLVTDIPVDIKRWLKRLLDRPFYSTDKISVNLHIDRNVHRRKLHQFLVQKGLNENDITKVTNHLANRWSSR